MVPGSRSPLPRPISVPDSSRQQLPMIFPTDPSYTAQALRTESPITPALQTRLQQQARLVHAVLGLQTEAGELADPVKKHIYYGRPLDLINLREEIGDCLWYLALAANALGTTLEAEQARNLAKLRTRFPHVFTAEAAQVRDLDREREVLEEHVADDPHTLRQQLDAANTEIDTLGGALVAADKRLRDAEQRVWPGVTWGCDAADKMADAILHLRQQLAEQQAETFDVRRQRINETDRLNATNAVSVQQRDDIAYLRARLDEERSVIAGLRKELADAQRAVSDAFAEVNSVREQLNAARAAVTLQRAGFERLQRFAEKIRMAHHCDNWPSITMAVDELDSELAKLDADTEPTLVAEPAPEVERLRVELAAAKAAQAAWQANSNLLERFAATVRSRFNPGWTENDLPEILSAVSAVFEALAELDAGTEPAPVAEPRPCPECERLRAFVEIMRGLLTAEYADQRIIAAAIAKLDDAEGRQ